MLPLYADLAADNVAIAGERMAAVGALAELLEHRRKAGGLVPLARAPGPFDHGEIDHLPVDFDGARRTLLGALEGVHHALRFLHFLGGRAELLVQDRDLRRVDHRGTGTSEPARAPRRRAKG